jgi:protein-arginine kinase activator protein McsA
MKIEQMKCQRCLRGEATYRVYTDRIDMKVCFACAQEASTLGIAVEVLHSSHRVRQGRVS